MNTRVVPLRIKLAMVVAAPLALVSIFIALFLPTKMETSASEWAERRAVGIVQVMSRAVQAGVDFAEIDGGASVTKYLEWLNSTSGVIYAAVRSKDGKIIASWTRDGKPHDEINDLAEQELVNDIVIRGSEGALRVMAPVVSEKEDGRKDIIGSVAIGVSLQELNEEKAQNRMWVLIASVIILVVGTAFGRTLGMLLTRPISGLTEATSQVVATGDLNQNITVHSNDETGVLAESFRQMIARLRDVVVRLKGTVRELQHVSSRLSSTADSVSTGADVLRARTEETSTLMVQSDAMLRRIGSNVVALRKSAHNVSESIGQMAASNTQVAKNSQGMSDSVDDTSAGIETMTSASVQIAERLRELDEALTQVSGSMNEIHSSIIQVEAHAKTTAQLAETVSGNADDGVAAVEKTVGGIENIRGASQFAVEVIERLVERITSIDDIVNVIRGVADQTNLLALNAAIIAAQSGEQGRGFSVVADEIKSLASRTRSSTVDIAQLITHIQEESTRAADAVRQGLQSAEDGVRLGRETREALTLILRSSRDASGMAQSIARATLQQSNESHKVTTAVNRIATHLQEISQASLDHARTSEHVMTNTKRMRGLTHEVRSASEQQAASSTQIVRAVGEINTMVSEVSDSQHQQAEGSRQVLEAVKAIAEVAERETASVAALTQAVTALQKQATDLSMALDEFRV